MVEQKRKKQVKLKKVKLDPEVIMKNGERLKQQLKDMDRKDRMGVLWYKQFTI